jgi:hypothetical protein
VSGTSRKKSSESATSEMTMPVVVRTDRKAAAASRPLRACSPIDRRVRVFASDGRSGPSPRAV